MAVCHCRFKDLVYRRNLPKTQIFKLIALIKPLLVLLVAKEGLIAVVSNVLARRRPIRPIEVKLALNTKIINVHRLILRLRFVRHINLMALVGYAVQLLPQFVFLLLTCHH